MSLDNVKATLDQSSSNNIKLALNPSSGSLQTSSPLSLRNAARDSSVLREIEGIQNIQIVQKVDGSSLQFNSETQNYEVKLMSLDGGSF